MTCAVWEERVALFAGGDLAAAEAGAVERHLSQCAACSALAADLRSGLDGLRQAHAESLAAAHYAVVRARVLAELSKSPRQRVVWAWAWAAALALAAAAVLVVVTMKPAAVPAPDLPRLVAVAPRAEHPAPREPASDRSLRSRERTGWQAKAPAPLKSGGKVGQTLSSVNQQVDPIVLAAVEDSPVRMVQLATADPNVVIYWLFEEKGEER
jgi:anti-sigma factor RsiW